MGKTEKGRETFYFDRAGIRKGNWKYLKADAHFYGYAREESRPKEEELYNLQKDIGEQKNLAKKHPKILAELRKLMEGMSLGPGATR